VIATGVQYSVRDVVDVASKELGMKIRWDGKGRDEVGYTVLAPSGNASARREETAIIKVDPRYFRPTEVESLLGDATKAKEKLGWVPKTSFVEMIVEMVREDLKSAERDELVKQHGFAAYDYHE
jgi:GDPmannose 4,6-dehydratase